MHILVTNKPPDVDSNVSQPLLELFQKYTLVKNQQRFTPFEHQAKVFRAIAADEDVFLVAGTAAGKTLAVAVPLFHKLTAGRIHRILLIYPTIALMNDQRRVMDELAKITGLEVGQLQGGMSRTRLIHELNKPVILATPDEVYWFFRKNVKYNSLLIYGLALIDEFVLDEAHLFNGLMLRNFEHLWWRVRALSNCLGKSPRLHVLTATPTEELRRLCSSQTILGESKCHDVQVEFRPCGRFDRVNQIVNAANKALASEWRKVLIVCNSARMAHQIFEGYKVSDVSSVPFEHQLRFGRVELGELTQWLRQEGMQMEMIDKLNARLFREEDVVLKDIPDKVKVELPLQEVIAYTAEALERQCWSVKRALWENIWRAGETWNSLLHNRPLPCEIVAALRERLEGTKELEVQKAIVDEWLTNTVEQLCNLNMDPVSCQAPEFTELSEAFVSAGLSEVLSSLLTKRLIYEMKVDPNQLPIQDLSHRDVYFHWLDWVLEKDEAESLREVISLGIQRGKLKVECRHIGLWKGTDVPVIVYSGSMLKRAREGLIDVFSDLERAILISTSAAEVGVDFDADTLITEECEGNSFLQRFGRVGRRGGSSQVIAFVSGDVYAPLSDLNGTKISRKVFSDTIRAAFPSRDYAKGSELVDAHHYLINEQLGRIGERLNSLTVLRKAKQLAEILRDSEIQLNYGLRSTMPQITLRDGITKDPFYLLRYVDDRDLYSTDSPFEIAQAKVWFTNLIFKKAKFSIIVDLEETLKASRNLIIVSGDQPRIIPQQGIGCEYLNRMEAHFRQTGDWDKWHPGNFILLHGDVYLSRIDMEVPSPKPIQDSEQNPIFIPDQIYIVLWGWTDTNETEQLLKNAGTLEWEELHYDWDRLRQDWKPRAMVIMEKTTGACYAAYKELVRCVDNKIQR